MSVESDLLARICAEPSNLEPRLVYADRLSDLGDPRGAFIAQQCELEALDVLDESYARVLASSRRLASAHAAEWLADYVKRTKIDRASYSRSEIDRHLNADFERGFLRRIAMRPEDIAKEWTRLKTREPVLGIELLVGEHLPSEHSALEEPASFRVLKVSPQGWFTANSVGNVLAWGMPELREIDLTRCDLGPTGCKLLANLETDLGEAFTDWREPPPFASGQIERLELQSCSITDAGARVLFDADPLDGIRELGLGGCRLREKETLAALRDARRMKQLTRLSLAGNNDLRGQLGSLAGWEALPRLERIALPQTTSGGELGALFPSPSASLRELDLSSAKELVQTPRAVLVVAEALSHLDIGSSSIGDAGFAQLVAAPCMTRLIELRANGCSLSDKGIVALTASKLRHLVTLDLSSNKLSDHGMATLAAWPGLEHVTHLRIGNNRKLAASGYAALIEAKHFMPVALDVGKMSDKTLVARLRERFGAGLVVGAS